jgi:hypothetical protein
VVDCAMVMAVGYWGFELAEAAASLFNTPSLWL